MDCFFGVSMRFWVGQDELDIDRSHFRVHFWVKMRWKQRSRLSVMMDDIFRTRLVGGLEHGFYFSIYRE